MDKEVRRITRKRDKNICQKCKTKVNKRNSHVSHVKTKRRHPYLRHDLQNVKLLCFSCHIMWWHKEISEAWTWFQQEFPYRADYLDERTREYNEIGNMKKMTIDDLKERYEKLKSIS